MKRHDSIKALGVLAVGLMVGAALSAQDQRAVKSPNGIAFSEFKGYESWPVIAPSQPDDPGGCGESKDGCIKAIVGNATMIKAYNDGFPGNGKTVPDGAEMAKIEWHRKSVAGPPYGITAPGTLAGISFMIKDSKRFPDTNGWGYVTFLYDAGTASFKPSTNDPAVMRTSCHSCHTRFMKARDYVFTNYAKR
jgi:hypothetical protein